ncbi:hypothetical protein OJAV_G00158750 [Oryzias javanicus]|uniref:Uncharacterized protein n=1 Tax=Oryzias javanicus TaxID=123683 RepID=A0A3S2MMN6_ORYJA|nr:hypothetical protein OJAV_G00158750 [Oryzias javanicus]
MASTEWVTLCSNIILSTTALYFSRKLFKDHRGPSVGLFLLGLSATLYVLLPSSSHLASLTWAGEVLAPVLVTFDFLWLSEDHSTAWILLFGSCLLLGLSDWLSPDTLTVLTRCLGLSSLSCCLMVCLFAGNVLGAAGGVALSLPLLVVQQVETAVVAPLVAPAATEGLMKWLLNGLLSVGCWASTRALGQFLLDVTDRYNI